MTDYNELIAGAEAALEGVTPGPWSLNAENAVCNQIDGEHHAICTDQFCYAPERDANARFIAAARQDVPALLAALKAVIAERDSAVQTERDFWTKLSNQLVDKLEAAEAENAALRARVAELTDFLADFADTNIEAIHTPVAFRSPEDEPDPVVDAGEVWAWQEDAAALRAKAKEAGE